MRRVVLNEGADLEGFRTAARRLVAEGVPPEETVWSSDGALPLFGLAPAAEPVSPLRLPRAAAEHIETVVRHRDSERFALLYQFVWRVLHGERRLLEVPSDPLVHRLERMARSVRRDIHKMHAFLRFRRDEEATDERFVAWFEPEHFILEAAAPFFVERFRALRWAILTPLGSAHWDGVALTFGPAADRSQAPGKDAWEDSWRGYYESVFNPARINARAMRAEMPKKYWRNLPEATAIPHLVRTARSRVTEMLEQEATMPAKRKPEAALDAMRAPAITSLKQLNKLLMASDPLVPGATQAVPGEGPEDAEIVFVGEQPGDQEDRQGRPFVGPAGQLFDRALAEAGLNREEVYVTNAVKHFKFEMRGKRRIHQKPTAGEVKHYRWWLEKELELIKPKLVVALGGTAVLAMTGKSIPIIRARGFARFPDGYDGYITVHPSYLLRLPDEAAKAAAYRQFVSDLEAIRTIAADHPRGRVRAPAAAE